jgi:hypothetical protein
MRLSPKSLVVLFVLIQCNSPSTDQPSVNEVTDTTSTSSLTSLQKDSAPNENQIAEQPSRFDSTAAQPYQLYDSLEYNVASGILNRETKGPMSATFVFYAYDRYEEYGFKLGDTLNGYFANGKSGLLTSYSPKPVATQYDSVNKWLTFPLFPEGEWPAFLLKGLSTKDVKGKLIDWEFFEPGDSLTVRLGENKFFLHVEGTTVGYVVKNYKLYLESTINSRNHKALLFGHKYLPFVNATDIIPDFIHWIGDLNNDNILDLITGDGMKSCSTMRLWIGTKNFTFEQKARFDGCGC